MKTSIKIILLIVFLLNSTLMSGPDSVNYRIRKTYFKVGINTNYLFHSTRIQEGFTGAGIFFELHVIPEFSLAGLFNTLKIKRENKEGSFGYFPDFSDHEINIKLRYHRIFNRLSVLSELGLGTWGSGDIIIILGVGIEHNILRNFSAALVIDYNNMSKSGSFFSSSGGFSDKFLRLNISINYLITIREKKMET